MVFTCMDGFWKRSLGKQDAGFMTGRGTGDSVFILRRLTEKYWSKGRKLFYYGIYIYIYYIYMYICIYVYIYIYPKPKILL